MLESASLVLLPWALEQGTAGPGAWSRHVLADGVPGGLIRCTERRRGWLGWFPSYRLEVLETEDEALLLTLVRSRSLFRLWDLYDAEENRIGSIYPPVLLDSEGQRRGYLQVENGHQGQLLGLSGRPLAEFKLDATKALHLHFTAEADFNPYMRMLLLGGALTLQPPPQ
jgi:hypothetical protein